MEKEMTGYPLTGNYEKDIKVLLTEINKLKKQMEIKDRSSLANNLCPDHRDKQVGKTCIACENETLKKKLDRAIAAWLRERGAIEKYED